MGPDDWPPVAVVVPDDIRELDADVAAYHRELRRSGAAGGWRRIFLTRRWARSGLSGPILVVVLVTVAFVGSLMALFPPEPAHLAKPGELATPTVAPGRVGGLLPDVRLDVEGKATAARGLRPALLFTVPRGCDCTALVRALVSQATQYSLQVVLVMPALPVAESQRLRDATLGRAQLAKDTSGVMQSTFGADTLVFVRADGVVLDLASRPTPQSHYELLLAQLVALSSAA